MGRRVIELSAGLTLALACACSSTRSEPTPIGAEPASRAPLIASSRAESESAPAPRTGPFIEVVLGNERKLLDGPCAADARAMGRPYLEVLDPNTASPRVILDACGSNGFYFDIVGRALRLPGPVTPMRLRITDIRSNEEWEASDVKFEVTSFGAPGDVVSGTFSGTMSPRLNRDPVPIRGSFSVVRAPDRYAP